MSTWSKPSVGTVKVNVKGVFQRSHLRASIACVMRDSDGRWLGGCESMIGLSIQSTAELWSIWYGLKLAWEAGKTSVTLECESEEAVNHVLHPDENYEMFQLVLMIRQIMSEAWDVCDIVHIPSSSNLPATALANRALNGDGGLEYRDVPPSFIRSLLNAEKRA